MAPYKVKQQYDSSQAVTCGIWRATDSTENSGFVLPSCYLNRQKTNGMRGSETRVAVISFSADSATPLIDTAFL